MKSRVGLLVSCAVVALLIFGFTLQRSGGSSNPEQKGQKQQAGKARPERQKAERSAAVAPHSGPSIAFDVRPRDHRATARYVLEITHPSGELTVHDLAKPKLQKRTIIVPLPKLEPGKYSLVIIAESPGGATRSSPLVHEVTEK